MQQADVDCYLWYGEAKQVITSLEYLCKVICHSDEKCLTQKIDTREVAL
jgi:hypothetical protein